MWRHLCYYYLRVIFNRPYFNSSFTVVWQPIIIENTKIEIVFLSLIFKLLIKYKFLIDLQKVVINMFGNNQRFEI